MPSPPETINERHDELVRMLRAARPQPSEQLRERVQMLATTAAPPRRPRFELRRAVPVLAAALLVAAVAAAAIGVGSRDSRVVGGGGEEAVRAPAAPRPAAEKAPPASGSDRGAAPDFVQGRSRGAAAPAPSRRLQDYRAELHVRVRDLDALSSSTARAMRATRSLGGFVVVARYDAPRGDDGDSLLVVRVPVGRVQDAIARFSQLGTIVAQRIDIQDVQQGVNRQDEQIAALRRTVATLERELARTDLTQDERARLRLRLLSARETLRARVAARDETVRRARLATVSLTLTTRNPEELAPKPRGELEQTLRDAVSVLGTILTWLLAALIVAAPFLALAAAGVALERARRRRAERRLLENA